MKNIEVSNLITFIEKRRFESIFEFRILRGKSKENEFGNLENFIDANYEEEDFEEEHIEKVKEFLIANKDKVIVCLYEDFCEDTYQDFIYQDKNGFKTIGDLLEETKNKKITPDFLIKETEDYYDAKFLRKDKNGNYIFVLEDDDLIEFTLSQMKYFYKVKTEEE